MEHFGVKRHLTCYDFTHVMPTFSTVLEVQEQCKDIASLCCHQLILECPVLEPTGVQWWWNSLSKWETQHGTVFGDNATRTRDSVQLLPH